MASSLWSVTFALPSPARKSAVTSPTDESWDTPILGSVSGSSGAQGLSSPSPVASLPCQVPLYQPHGCTSPHPLHTPGASPISKCSTGQSPLIRLQIPKRDWEVITPWLGPSPRPASEEPSLLAKGAAFPQTPAAGWPHSSHKESQVLQTCAVELRTPQRPAHGWKT